MYGLFKVEFRADANSSLICVSESPEQLLHYYNCMDRDETRGRKLYDTSVEQDIWPTLRRVYHLRHTCFLIQEVLHV